MQSLLLCRQHAPSTACIGLQLHHVSAHTLGHCCLVQPLMLVLAAKVDCTESRGECGGKVCVHVWCPNTQRMQADCVSIAGSSVQWSTAARHGNTLARHAAGRRTWHQDLERLPSDRQRGAVVGGDEEQERERGEGQLDQAIGRQPPRSAAPQHQPRPDVARAACPSREAAIAGVQVVGLDVLPTQDLYRKEVRRLPGQVEGQRRCKEPQAAAP